MTKLLALGNSDTSLPPAPTSVNLSDGTPVTIDDYVYLQTDFPDEPFYIGRIMEFVYVPRVRQPKPLLSDGWQNGHGDDKGRFKREDTPMSSSSSATPAPSAQLRARLAWFQRPRDLPVSRAKTKDTRLLIATMHSDLNPVSVIKGKCFVRHSREINDMGAWKSAADHYYYNQLFDRYSTRLYDIVPVNQIRNAPQDVLQKLTDTYEFIFAEPQKIADLVNTRRACTICAKWCSIGESLKCSLCEKHYHMQCLDPPLSRKPAKGYSWQCAACLRRMQEQRVSGAVTEAAILETGDRKRTTRAAQAEDSGAGLRSGSSAAAAASDTESRSGSKRLKTGHSSSDSMATAIPRPRNRGLWPFRYFGVNTNIEDVLHDDERIYPRAVSRIGPKYQAIVPDMVSPAGAALDAELTARKKQAHSGKDGEGVYEVSNVRSGAGAVANSGAATGAAVVSGGGGGTTRWHGKSAEQMDRMWDAIEAARGSGNAQLFFQQPRELDNDELDMYTSSILPYLRRHFAGVQDFTLLDCQDAALHGLAQHAYDVEEALITIPECPEAYVRPRSSGDVWTADDIARFNECLREYGANLQAVHEALPHLTRRAVVLHYYLIKPSSLGQHLLEDFGNRNRAAQRRLNLGQGEGAGAAVHLEVASDAGVSGANTPASSPRIAALSDRAPRRCIHCQQETSARWHAAPADFTVYNTRSAKTSGAQRIICTDCREHWLHYAAMPDQDAINARKTSTAAGSRASSALRNPSRVRNAPPLMPTLPRARTSDPAWPLAPCDVCRLATRGSDQTVLTCQDCGVCVHMGCSGYPARARVHPRRWRCAVCSNVATPTVSINYACILCRRGVHHTRSELTPAADRPRVPRPLMWRTSGNNWVHARCALAEPELRLAYAHGNVVVSGVSRVPSDAWTRACSVCQSTDGAVVPCCHQSCGQAAHAACVHASVASSSTSSASAPVLVGRIRGATGADFVDAADTLRRSVVEFVDRQLMLDVVLRCARHSAGSPHDIDLGTTDAAGVSVVSAVVAAKSVAGPPVRTAARAGATAGADVSTQQAPVVSPGSVIKSSPPPLPALSPAMPAAEEEAADKSQARDQSMPRMVVWSSPSADPVCAQCSSEYSPIWWPTSPAGTTAAANGADPASNGHSSDDDSSDDDGVKVLCHRCYTTSTSSLARRSNVAL
ncbi:putative PHD type zinc finger protein with BAH domain-containing protein [Coemansia sp. RSA 1286]|nr:putative PHD type zinc finger protein with BAH domain-containing protein [Coemansia sp. RSA 485]KAJ2599710.1 putative PHD type zinc finger protein with BAH domain-containing protein [Coemansia sp. RSA 1721]KAJ2637693.1 putative PHD type zinc finger protein with BAH domain-containing protein [Coemansia sp. RSA 1286]